MEQLQSILTDLDNKAITKHQAYDLILVLFDISGSLPSNNLPKDDYRNDTHDQNGKEISFWQ
jgi:hypothetical protein